MSFLKFKTYYTALVEHYFRMAVRYKTVTNISTQNWHIFTNRWIDLQSKEDKKFILFVFDYQFRNTLDGLRCFEPTETLYAKRERLAKLEKQFATDSGVYDEVSDSGITA